MSEEIVKTEDEIVDSETRADGKNPTCPICKHIACEKASEIYFQNGNKIDAAKHYFENEFKKVFNDSTYNRHFKKHVDPFVKSFMVIKKRKIDDLREEISKDKEGIAKLPLIKAMIYKYIEDVYAARPEDMKSMEDKKTHRELSKELVELSKAFKDMHQLEIEILGFGKTPEEQKQAIENHMSIYIQELLDEFNDMPDAKDKLQKLISRSVSGDKE